MPFSLKNVGATYQRMMARMFKSQLGKSIEVYIDDMVIKSKVVSEHLRDLGSIFEVLRKHKLRLNTSKCSVGVGSSKFLGYMVTHKGIEINPDQIKSINSLQPSRNTKEVQKLTVMTTALNRFISQSADRALLWSVDYMGKIAKWATILEAFDIKYMPRTFVKEQVLVDLVVEFAESPLEEETETQSMDGKLVDTISQQSPLSWEVYVDGTANQKSFEVGLVLVSPKRITIKKSLRLRFSATNNEAKYEALLMGMTMVRTMGRKAIKIFSDSRLVINQVKGEFEVRDERM
ncbi:uncharacterized protein LOC136068233 [Quercus suber]|uniref:uncharacterized protein LOC136068233 n=1 Tax=Quercus suber TaxID=58331 RepID=UPI0032DE4203